MLEEWIGNRLIVANPVTRSHVRPHPGHGEPAYERLNTPFSLALLSRQRTGRSQAIPGRMPDRIGSENVTKLRQWGETTEMAVKYPEITDRLEKFISEQKVFFVGTAAAGGRINVSPKGLDTLRIINKNRVVWLSLTGSGNETAAHAQENPRMTLMFCAFEGKPMILRLYGTATVIHQNNREWDDLFALFNPIPGARQIFDLSVDMAQTSCGIGVPYYHYAGERDMLEDWAIRKDGQDGQGLKRYWEEKNQYSIDGIPSHIMEKNT